MAGEQFLSLWELASLVALCTIAMATNALAVRRCMTTFNIACQTVYLLILLDGAVSCICAATTATFIMATHFERNLVTCTVPFMALYITNVVGIIINSEIAIIR